MISIISIADGVLRDRAAAFQLKSGRLYVVGRHRSYSAALYAEIDTDSSAFEIGAARWTGTAWESYPPAPELNAAGVAAQRARELAALAASDPAYAKVVTVLKTAGLL